MNRKEYNIYVISLCYYLIFVNIRLLIDISLLYRWECLKFSLITARRKWGLMGNRYINDIFLKAVFYRVNHCGITKDTISHARSRQGLRPVGARACRPIVNAYKLYILVSRANFDKANMIFYIVNLRRHTYF